MRCKQIELHIDLDGFVFTLYSCILFNQILMYDQEGIQVYSVVYKRRFEGGGNHTLTGKFFRLDAYSKISLFSPLMSTAEKNYFIGWGNYFSIKQTPLQFTAEYQISQTSYQYHSLYQITSICLLKHTQPIYGQIQVPVIKFRGGGAE